MKSFIVLATAAVVFNATNASASFFEVCSIRAQVTAVSNQVPTLNGSNRSVPGEASTYNRLVTLVVSDAKVPGDQGSHTNCKGHIGKSYELVASSGEGYAVGQPLDITLKRMNGRVPNGVAHQESWTVNKPM